MRRVVSMLSFALVPVLVQPALSAALERHRLLETGISAIAAVRSGDAVQPLIAARRIDTNEPVVHLALGTAVLHQGRTSEAQAAFADALALCATQSQGARLAQSGIAICLLTKGEFQKAASDLQKYIASDPDASAVRACLAHALLKMGRFSEAASHASRVKDDPLVDSFALGVYGMALLEAGAASEAAKVLPKALARCPGPIYEPSNSTLVIGPRHGEWQESPVMRVIVDHQAAGQIAVEPSTLPAGTASVALYVNGVLRQASNQTPSRFTVDGGLPPGLHTISLEAYDVKGNMVASAAYGLEVDAATQKRADPEDLAAVVKRLGPWVRPLPDRAALHYSLGRALERVGRLATAAGEYEACFAIRAQHPGVSARLGSAYRRLRISGPSDRPIRQAPKKKPPIVALTFDDGPHPFFTPKLLGMLRQHGIRAAFFVVGNQVLSYPDLARQIAADGHEIGSHTFTHPNLNFLTPTAVQQEILRTKLVLRKVVGRQSLLFRPPGGRYGQKERDAVAALGYRTVFWTSNIHSGKVRDAHTIAARMATELSAGGIALLHNGRDETLQVLPLLIERLKRKGVRFVTVSQLSRASRR